MYSLFADGYFIFVKYQQSNKKKFKWKIKKKKTQ
jgi:hypothetical protein